MTNLRMSPECTLRFVTRCFTEPSKRMNVALYNRVCRRIVVVVVKSKFIAFTRCVLIV